MLTKPTVIRNPSTISDGDKDKGKNQNRKDQHDVVYAQCCLMKICQFVTTWKKFTKHTNSALNETFNHIQDQTENSIQV